MAKLIKNWIELSKCKSETHVVEVDMRFGGAWVRPKIKDESHVFGGGIYLSTHAFYGSEYEKTTKKLQDRGFGIEIDNWDKEVQDDK